VQTRYFLLIAVAVAAIVFFFARWVNNDYVFFAGYTVLQFVVLATAWNILGGYTGYVNFGSAAFFAMGAYSTVFFHKLYPLPIPLLILIGGVVSGIVGLGMGYLTLRLRGAFFAIATLALAVVLQTIIVNWNFVGGARGAYVIRPNEIAFIGPYIHYLFLLMLALSVAALTIARGIERSQLGYGFATIRDDELAAEASGVPTLHLKLFATTLSGRAVPVLHRLPAASLRVRARICRQLDRHADDRRDHELGRAAGRRDPAGDAAAGRDRHHLVRRQPADRRVAAGRLCHHRAERHRRSGPAAQSKDKDEVMPLLEVQDLSKRFGGFVALDDIALSVNEGERVGLIGPNGSGKSTLVNCICGTLINETGTVRFNGETMEGLLTHERTRRGIARSFQLPRPFASLTVAENLRVPMLYTVNARPGAKLAPAELDARCAELLQLVALEEKAAKLPRDLTQVEMRKLELARAMAADPKLLIADESMAGLSNSEVTDIVALLIRLNERGITIIMIEHIMRAVMSFSQRLVVLVSGKKIADGKPDVVIRDPEVERAYLGQ
jgi:branched-chain amino acid transport system ATP-binding protein